MSQTPALQRTLQQLHALCVPGKIFECHCRWKWCPNCSPRTTHFNRNGEQQKYALRFKILMLISISSAFEGRGEGERRFEIISRVRSSPRFHVERLCFRARTATHELLRP